MKTFCEPRFEKTYYAFDKDDLDELFGLSCSDIRCLQARYLVSSDNNPLACLESIHLDEQHCLFLAEMKKWWQERMDTAIKAVREELESAHQIELENLAALYRSILETIRQSTRIVEPWENEKSVLP